MKKIIVLLALTCLCTAVNAASYSLTVNAGSNIGRGSLVTDATGVATSGSLVMTSGVDIGTYALFSGGSTPALSPYKAFIFDNMTFNNSALALDVWGLLFVGNGLEINIWGNGSGKPYSFWSANVSTYYNVSSDAASFTLEVQPVPVPAAAWLFGSALIGLVGIGKRRRKQWKALAS